MEKKFVMLFCLYFFYCFIDSFAYEQRLDDERMECGLFVFDFITNYFFFIFFVRSFWFFREFISLVFVFALVDLCRIDACTKHMVWMLPQRQRDLGQSFWENFGTKFLNEFWDKVSERNLGHNILYGTFWSKLDESVLSKSSSFTIHSSDRVFVV